MRRVAGLGLGAALLLGAACASAPAAPPLIDISDARGDVRLRHPGRTGISSRTFDLETLTLTRRADGRWQLEARFAEPLRVFKAERRSEDQYIDILPQTLDLYLDTMPGAGHVEALEGRGFHVPAAEAWDRVLVVSSVEGLTHDDLRRPQMVSVRGRRLVATFAADAVRPPVRGFLAVVLATSPRGDGWVRRVTPGLGNCHVWDDARCTVTGEGPAVFDATSEITAGRPVRLAYPKGDRPAPAIVPVVFTRGPLIGAAPVDSDRVNEGDVATVVAQDGRPLATAIVISVVGDTASLRVMGEASLLGAVGVVFTTDVEAPPPLAQGYGTRTAR